MSDVKTENDPVGSGNVELENLRRDAAGKDKKISELVGKVKALEQRLSDTGADSEERVKELDRLRQIASELKAYHGDLANKEKALAAAVERGVPAQLMLRGADDLDNFLGELGQLEQVILARHGWTPKAGASKSRLTYEDVKRMTRGELSRIPASVLERLQSEAQDG